MATRQINYLHVLDSVTTAEGLEYARQVESAFWLYSADISQAETIQLSPLR
jgi:hypothetical protein